MTTDLPAIVARDARAGGIAEPVPFYHRNAADRRALLALVGELRDELEAHEWVEAEEGPGSPAWVCPSCDGWKPNHHPSCSLDELLARTAVAPRGSGYTAP